MLWMRRRGVRNRLARRPFYRFMIPVVILLLIFSGVQLFYFIERNIRVPLMNIARVQVHQMATESIIESISKKIVRQTDIRDLIMIQYDNKGVIQNALFNYSEYARIQAETTARVHEVLRELEEQEIEIPLGQAFNSNILAHLGPKISVHLRPMGSATVDLEFDMQTAGINMVMVTVYAVIKAQVAIVIPFSVESGEVSTRVALSNAVIVGQVPNFYYSSGGSGGRDPAQGGGTKDPSNDTPLPPVMPIIPPVEF